MRHQEQIAAYILEEKILDREGLERLLEQERSTGEGLVNQLKKSGLVDGRQLARLVALVSGVDFIELTPDAVDTLAAHMIPLDMATEYCVIPVKRSGNDLFVAMSSPLNLAVRDQIEARTGCKVIPQAAAAAAIMEAVRYHFSVQNTTRQTIASMRLKADDRQAGGVAHFKNKPDQVADAPITKLVSSIITGAIDARASDVHIEPQEPDVRVRYRVDGILQDAVDVPASARQELIGHIKILAEMDIAERRLPQDGHLTFEHMGREYDLRVSSLPTVGGEKVVIRVLDKSANKWVFDNIVPSAEDKRKLKSLLDAPHGMILVTGPTGSGKTTTLYSALQLLNTPGRNIVTAEDPVEYCLDGINQVQVNPAAGLVFAKVLRSVLRQDPDVILVGEIRDLETAEIAISASLTGHLVLSTLHTNDAAGAITRLINLGVQPFLVASSLLGVVAQRLVRTICPTCRRPYTPPADELSVLSGADLGGETQLFHGGGCSGCRNSGYQGRKAVYEVLCITPEISKLITEGASDEAIKDRAVAAGMKTLYRSAIEEVVGGSTTIEEMARVIDVRANRDAGVPV
jgi:type IV pilus assembly protein PilB